MIKNVVKRSLSILITILMLAAIMPSLSIPAWAAAVNTGVTGLTADSSGNATWGYSNGTITGSVKANKTSGCTGDSFTAQNGTLTFTNGSGAKAQLSFDYSLTLSGGSVEVDGAAVTAGASFSKTVDAGGTVAVKITSNASDDNATTISISNLKLTAEQDVDVTFSAPVNGAYTVNGEAITAQTVKTFKTTDSVALAATPASGCKFLGWYSSAANGFIAFSASATTSFSEATTVEPRFVPAAAPVFQVGSMLFTDLNEAIGYAQSSNTAKIALVSNGTLPAGNYTIPSGKTLVIPFDEAQTVYTTAPGMTLGSDGKPAKHVNPSAFRTLTMASGANITVASGGAISVPSMLSAVGTGSGSWNATPTGKHGRITMNTGSSIDVQSGGKLYVYGYISGSGKVYARSGAEVWECFQIRCWRGGTATSGMADNSQKVFPLNQYYVQNIEAPITYYPGATEKVFAAVNMSNQQFGASATFIGNGGMFQLKKGTATKRFTGASDRLEFSVDSVDGDLADFAIHSMSLRITGLPLIGTLDLNTADYVLPIQSNITINVNSGTTTLSQDVAFLPGSEMNIANGATVTVDNGFKAYVYDKDQWGEYAIASGQLCVVGYSTVNGTTAKRNANSLVDAKIDVNGTLTVAGQLYTTASGAAIISSAGTGKVVLQAAPGTETNTYMATQSGSDISYVSIPITAAKLQNADSSYVETAGKPADTEIQYSAGRWGGELAEITVKFDANGGTGAMPDATVTAGQTLTFPDGSAFTAPEGKHFAGWTSDLTGDQVFAAGSEFTIPEDVTVTEITLKANWAFNTYTITWIVDGVETEETYEYGQTPVYKINGEPATPTKEGDAQYSYTFAGWTPAVTTVSGNAEYTAKFTETTNEYTVTFVDDDGTVLKAATEYEYGTPASEIAKPADPTKEATVQYTYVFAGWSPEIKAVTGNVTYTATYSESLRKYTVKFFDDDGKTLLGEPAEYDYGTAVEDIETPTPTKEATAQYTYTFAGWDHEIVAVTGDAEYIATYTATTREYTITWKNDNGSVIDTTQVAYDVTPTHADPTKDADAEFTYEFDKWTPDIQPVTGPATYTATYTATKNSYTVTWVIDGESTTETYEYGETPAHQNPTKAATTQYTYTFDGWDDGTTIYAPGTTLPDVTGDVTYTAVFEASVNEYTVTWNTWDGRLIDTTTVAYGSKPVYSTEPIRLSNAQYTYEFAGWATKEDQQVGTAVADLPAVTGNIDYYAAYTWEVRTYIIKWQDENGELIDTTMVSYGDNPTFVAPVKEADKDYTYSFAGWLLVGSDPEHILADEDTVTESATYKATYTETAQIYTFVPGSWSWTGDDSNGYTAATATLKAGVGDFTKTVDATFSTETTDATCTEPGKVVYTASVTDDTNATYTDSKTVMGVPLGHDWDDPTYVWADDNSTVTATRVCKRDATHVETETVETTSEVTTPATCEGKGETTYTATFTNAAFATQTKTVENVAPIGHDWDAPTYAWADDNSTVTATRVCKNNASHTETETVGTTSEVTKPATCEANGETTYTATFTNAAFETQTKTVENVPAPGHDWKFVDFTWTGYESAVANFECTRDESHRLGLAATISQATTAPTCEAEGKTVYTATLNAADSPDNQTHIDTKTVAIPSLDHEWGVPTYEWSADNSSVTATRVCSRDSSHVETETVNTTSVVTTPATCEAKGETTYTATFTNPAFAKQTKTVENIEATGHAWGEPTYTWSDDNSKVTATRVCANEANHVETETVETASKVTKPATCEAKGETTYTATFTNTAFVTQTKTVENVDALGHNWGTPTYEWAEDNSKVTATRVCANDANHVETETVETASEVTKPATCEAKGETTYTATFANPAFAKQTKTVENIEATGHAWGEPTYTWLDDNSTVTATRVCKNDPEHVETETVNTTSEVTTEATCETKGKTTYTAEFENEAFATQTKEVENVDALGHDWGEPVWEWEDDYSAATATFTCERDHDHVKVKVAEITPSQTDSKLIYTATVIFEGQSYTNVKEVARKYTVTFVDEDGETILKEATLYDYGTPAASIEKPDDPSKEATAQYTYEFDGWDPEIADVTGNATYTATYSSTVNKYTITWMNGETVLETDENVPYDEMPHYDGDTPEKEGDDQYSYVFAGWNPIPVKVTGNATYFATFTPETNKYTVTFVDEDGTVLKDAVAYEYGTPAASIEKPDDPTKEATAQYTYSFVGWQLEGSDHFLTEDDTVTGPATYVATYSSTVNQYTVTFVDDDGTVLKDAVAYDYGTPAASIEKPDDPTKEATAQYTYTFDGWDPVIKEVVENVTYTATYSSILNKYTITFKNEDGTVLKQSDYDYGTPADDIVRPDDPTKPADTGKSYQFTGWLLEGSDPEHFLAEGDTVTGPVTYTAQFKLRNCLNIHRNAAAEQDFLYVIKGTSEGNSNVNTQVVLRKGEKDVYVVGLPDGDYTVTEVATWSWRVTPVNRMLTATFSADANRVTVTFGASSALTKWLNAFASVVNVITGTNG